jgi:hypothetical protein
MFNAMSENCIDFNHSFFFFLDDEVEIIEASVTCFLYLSSYIPTNLYNSNPTLLTESQNILESMMPKR